MLPCLHGSPPCPSEPQTLASLPCLPAGSLPGPQKYWDGKGCHTACQLWLPSLPAHLQSSSSETHAFWMTQAPIRHCRPYLPAAHTRQDQLTGALLVRLALRLVCQNIASKLQSWMTCAGLPGATGLRWDCSPVMSCHQMSVQLPAFQQGFLVILETWMCWQGFPAV